MIKNLNEGKYIDIYFFDNVNELDNIQGSNQELSKDIIVCDSILKIKDSYDNFITCLKNILKLQSSMIYRTNILRDICQNIPFVIISCGPSSNIDYNKLKKIENTHCILTVKYVRDILIENDIGIDFTLTSCYINNNIKFSNINPNETKTISVDVVTENDSTKDIVFKKNGQNHIKTFNTLLKNPNLNLFKITENKITESLCLFNQAHIMLEIAIPIVILMGSNTIYTFGWDGPKIRDGIFTEYNYNYNENCKYRIVHNQKKGHNEYKYTEYPYIEIIDKLLRDENINLYKCNEISNINLRYKNILL
jgi:hypothetical protein